MNIQSAVLEGTNILKDKSILSAQLDTEILMSKAINKNREYIILNHDEALNKENNDDEGPEPTTRHGGRSGARSTTNAQLLTDPKWPRVAYWPTPTTATTNLGHNGYGIMWDSRII